MSERKKERKEKKEFYERLPFNDKNRALKFIIYGFIFALIFATISATSASLAGNAQDWADVQNEQNKQNLWDGVYGYHEYIERSRDIDYTKEILEFQSVIIVNVARIGVNIGLVFIVLGFLGITVNEEMDKKARIICLIFASVILLLVVTSMFFQNIIFQTVYA